MYFYPGQHFSGERYRVIIEGVGFHFIFRVAEIFSSRFSSFKGLKYFQGD